MNILSPEFKPDSFADRLNTKAGLNAFSPEFLPAMSFENDEQYAFNKVPLSIEVEPVRKERNWEYSDLSLVKGMKSLGSIQLDYVKNKYVGYYITNRTAFELLKERYEKEVGPIEDIEKDIFKLHKFEQM